MFIKLQIFSVNGAAKYKKETLKAMQTNCRMFQTNCRVKD